MITREDPEWEPLYKTWIEEKKPGWVILGGKTYRVLQPSDNDIRFELQSGGIDAAYASVSTKGISR